MSGPRPVGVSIITIIIVIYGISAVVTGILGLFHVFGNAGSLILVTSLLVIVLGLVYLAVAKGLWNGSAGARAIVAILSVIGLIVGVVELFGSAVASGIWHIVISLIILAVLYSAKAKAFFA